MENQYTITPGKTRFAISLIFTIVWLGLIIDYFDTGGSLAEIFSNSFNIIIILITALMLLDLISAILKKPQIIITHDSLEYKSLFSSRKLELDSLHLKEVPFGLHLHDNHRRLNLPAGIFTKSDRDRIVGTLLAIRSSIK